MVAAWAAWSGFESAASRKNSHRPAACVPAEPNACSIFSASRPNRRPTRGGRSQRTGRARRVKDLVVGLAEKLADPNADFVSRDGCDDEFASRCADRLRDRQGGRKHDSRRMKHRTIVDVVLLGDMRRGRIDQSREEGRSRTTADQHFRWTLPRSHRGREGVDRLDRPHPSARERGAEPVEHQRLAAAEHRFRNSAVVERRGKFGEALFGREGHWGFPGHILRRRADRRPRALRHVRQRTISDSIVATTSIARRPRESSAQSSAERLSRGRPNSDIGSVS